MLQFLEEMLYNQYGKITTEKIIEGLSQKRLTTLRTNTLKANSQTIENELRNNGINFNKPSWNEDAFIIVNAAEKQIRTLKIYEDGKIYMQSLSSMLPAIILDPKPKENILDMAAAPGGKTIQMLALTNNEAYITACEKNKVRAEKLKYNIQKQGASGVNILVQDARKLSDYFSFDKILLDAPCSGSGTIYWQDENLENSFTQELISRSAKVQYDLLKKAVNILKDGQEMVYSTCSILIEENENNINKLLQSKKIEIMPIDENKFKDVPFLPTKLKGTIAIRPTNLYEGFFIAKLRKRSRI